MSDGPRDIRDVVAEAMRHERLGLVRPLWSDWCDFDNEGGPEDWRRRADHLIRLMRQNGISVVRTGTDAAPLTEPNSRVIYRFKLHGRQAERLIRKSRGDDWQVVLIENGTEIVEQTFTVRQALIDGGLVLIDHPDAKSIPRLGRQLAALVQIYHLNATAMEPAP